jgi:hypothetical protein
MPDGEIVRAIRAFVGRRPGGHFSTDPKPREIWPKGKPVKNADDYFRLVVALDLQTIVTVAKALTDDDVVAIPGLQAELAKSGKKPTI